MQSDEINELATALALAQGEMQNATLNRENPHFKSRYADLAAIRDATVPSLSKHGLSLTQQMLFDTGGLRLVSRLMHKSGQWLGSEYPLPTSGRPQEMGSALTYARRYSWQSLCGISAEEDDDANAAQDAAPAKSNGKLQPKRTQAEISGQKTAKENTHAAFEDDLRDVDSLPRLALFETVWADKLKGEGGHRWTMQNKLENRRKELSEPVDDEPNADGVLPDKAPTTRAEYIQWCHDRIAGMTTDLELGAWWKLEKHARTRFRLTAEETQALADRCGARKAELAALPPSVAEAAHLIAGAG